MRPQERHLLKSRMLVSCPDRPGAHEEEPIMTATELVETAEVPTVTLDLYRDIHKGIRAELFALTSGA